LVLYFFVKIELKTNERNGTEISITVFSLKKKLGIRMSVAKMKYLVEFFFIPKKMKNKCHKRKKGNILSINRYDDHSLKTKDVRRKIEANSPTHLLNNLLPMKNMLIIFNKKKNLIIQNAFLTETPKNQNDNAINIENRGLRSNTPESIWFIVLLLTISNAAFKYVPVSGEVERLFSEKSIRESIAGIIQTGKVFIP